MKKNQDKQIEGIIYKGKEIEPYESFYHSSSDKFFRGQLGGVFLVAVSVMIL